MSDESSTSEVRKVMPFAAKACDFCKKRKIRCEGVMPCIQCQRRGFPCNFTSEQHKRGPKPKRKRRETISALGDHDDDESEVNLASERSGGEDVSKLKMELEIQKRLEGHWKKQYLDLLQKQEDPTPKTLSLSSLDPAVYLRTLLLNPNTTGLCLDPNQSPMLDQFSEISWSFIRDENTVYRLGQAFITCFNCGVIPTYNLSIDASDSVNQLIWKVVMLNTPLKINEFLKQESSGIVMQFFQSSLVYAHGIRAIDEEITYLDIANHLLLIINAAFNILFHQREVHFIPKYAKQLVHELMSLSNYLKYTGTGEAIKQLSPYLIQLVQQFESYIDDPELLANALSFLLSKSSSPSERDYWMTKMSAVSAKEPLNQVMKEFSVIYSALRVLVPGAVSAEMLYELQGRINVAELMLGTDRLTHETKSFFSVWFSMAKAEIYFRLNNMREHELAFKETLMRYYSLPRITFRKAMRGLSTLFCADGTRIMTADKIMQMVDETVIPYASVSRGLNFYPNGFTLPSSTQLSSSIVEMPAVGLEAVPSSASEESDQSPNALTSLSPDSLVDDSFDYNNITFSFDALVETQ